MGLTHGDRRPDRKGVLLRQANHEHLQVRYDRKNVVMTAEVIRHDPEIPNDLDLTPKFRLYSAGIELRESDQQFFQPRKLAVCVERKRTPRGSCQWWSAGDVEVYPDTDPRVPTVEIEDRMASAGKISEGTHRRDLSGFDRFQDSLVYPLRRTKVVGGNDKVATIVLHALKLPLKTVPGNRTAIMDLRDRGPRHTVQIEA